MNQDSTLNSQKMRGYFFALAATALWSGNFILARGLSESIPPISLAYYRWVVAIVFLLPFCIKPMLAQRDLIKKNILMLSLISILGVTVFNTFIYFAGQTTTAINLSLIAITFPIFILIFSRIFLKEKISKNKSFGVVFVLCGVLLLISKGELDVILNISFVEGDLWMFIAAIVFAIYSILLRYKPKGLNIWAFQLISFILGLIFLTPFYLWELQTTSMIVQINEDLLLGIFYVGIFASLFAYVLWNKSIHIIGAPKAGMIYYTIPIFSGALAYVFLNEQITMNHLYSVILIFTGIVLANKEFKKKKLSR
ncbi:MAG: DMT family transporter [Campylobacteraceae bacterium]|nr:DMT family transporter [Campylobacteraceae bacterium]